MARTIQLLMIPGRPAIEYRRTADSRGLELRLECRPADGTETFREFRPVSDDHLGMLRSNANGEAIAQRLIGEQEAEGVWREMAEDLLDSVKCLLAAPELSNAKNTNTLADIERAEERMERAVSVLDSVDEPNPPPTYRRY